MRPAANLSATTNTEAGAQTAVETATQMRTAANLSATPNTEAGA
jgi:hypothetical protein